MHHRGPFVRWTAAGLTLALSTAAYAAQSPSMLQPTARPGVHATGQPSPSLLAHWGIGIVHSPVAPPVVTKRQAEQFARAHLPFGMRLWRGPGNLGSISARPRLPGRGMVPAVGPRDGRLRSSAHPDEHGAQVGGCVC